MEVVDADELLGPIVSLVKFVADAVGIGEALLDISMSHKDGVVDILNEVIHMSVLHITIGTL